jgi:hypothetical protein
LGALGNSSRRGTAAEQGSMQSDCVNARNWRRQRILSLTLTGAGWDNPTMILTLDAKRRLTVPANLAPAEPGDHFIAEFDPEEDAIVFRRLARRADWLAVLRECPVGMDEVPQRSRQLPKRRRL